MAKKAKAPPPPSPVPPGLHLLAFGALALLVFAVYSPALKGEFQFDDAMGIERGLWKLPKDHEVAGLVSTLSGWTARGLVQATYQLNFWMGGGNEMKFLDLNRITRPFHVFNILFHVFVAGALYTLLAWMSTRRGRPSLLFPLLGAAYFALHPLASESVAYISARSGAMAAGCALWGIVGFVVFGAARAGGEASSLPSRFLAVAFLVLGTLLAVGCKETGWMAPPMGAAVLAWSYLGDRRALWRDWGPGILLGSVLFAGGMIYFMARVDLVDAILDQYRGAYGAGLPDAAFLHGATQLNAWFTVHLPRLLFPWHLTVDPSPPLLLSLEGWTLARALLQALAALALVLAGLWAWRRRSPAGAGALWILLALFPVSIAALLDVTTERHAYMPLAGTALVLAGLLEALPLRRVLLPAAGILFCALTAHRAGAWATEEALWRSAIRLAPGKPRPYYNWAKSLNRRALAVASVEGPRAGDLVSAAQWGFRAALRIFPAFHIAHSGMARTLQWQGRREEAVEEYRKAISSHEEALFRGEAVNMHAQQITILSRAGAGLLRELGHPEEGDRFFHQPVGYHLSALRQVPPGLQREWHQRGAVELLAWLALFQNDTGRPGEARKTLSEALRVFPGCPPLLDVQRRLGEKR